MKAASRRTAKVSKQVTFNFLIFLEKSGNLGAGMVLFDNTNNTLNVIPVGVNWCAVRYIKWSLLLLT